MKKKILLTLLMVAILSCLFTISAFAATEIDGIYYNLVGGENPYAKVTNDNATKCTLTDVNIPETVTYDGITYTVTEIDPHAFSGTQGNWGKNQTVKTLVIPKTVTKIGAHFLRECKSVETVVIKAKNEAGINLGDAEFYKCTSLKSVDLSESDIVRFGQYQFWGCESLPSIKLPPRLNYIGANSFENCKGLQSIDLSVYPVTTIGNYAFRTCLAMTEIKLPTTLTYIGCNAFQNDIFTSIVLPESLNGMSNDVFAFCNNLKLMVFPEIKEGHTMNKGFLYGTKPRVVIYSGDNYEYLMSQISNFASYTARPYSEYDPNENYTTNTIFYGATTCDNCNGLLEDEKFVFNGYDEDMVLSQTCTNCEKVNVTKNFGTMLKLRGFSAPVNGGNQMVIGFDVNEEAIKEYETRTNKTVNYGVFAILEKNYTGGDVINADGSVMATAVKAEVSKDYDSFDFKISGFETDEQKALGIALGVYVISSDNNVAYVQWDKQEGGLLFTSFDQLN